MVNTKPKYIYSHIYQLLSGEALQAAEWKVVELNATDELVSLRHNLANFKKIEDQSAKIRLRIQSITTTINGFISYLAL